MGQAPGSDMREAVQTAAYHLESKVTKPKLRGVLHQYAAAAVLSAGAILIIESPTPRATWASIIYVAAAALQFVVSAVYHTGNWQPSTHKLLMRLDHSAIYSLIAATYTPLILVPLAQHTDLAKRLLLRLWLGALFGVLKTWTWPNAPKPLSAAIYVVMGWSAVPYLRLFAEAVGLPVVSVPAAVFCMQQCTHANIAVKQTTVVMQQHYTVLDARDLDQAFLPT